MGGLNKRQRDKFYKIQADLYGEYCRNCKVSGTKKTLVLHHKNNNNKDNRTENHQLLCRRCNYLANPRKKPVDFVCVSVCEEPPPNELKENRRMEPLFRRWFFRQMNQSNPRRYDPIVNAGAEHVGASTETIKRYLRKMTSTEGMYQIITDPLGYSYIHFKKN